jgi:hypothetical protein
MAGSNAKKRLEANRARLRALATAAAATSGVFVAARLLLAKPQQTALGTWGGLAATALVHALSYAAVAAAAAPTYDARGGVVDGGIDLARTPLPSKAAAVGVDLIYLGCLAQLLSAALSPARGLWLYALAPAYALYSVLAPAVAYATGARRRVTARDVVTDDERERQARRDGRRERRAAKRF